MKKTKKSIVIFGLIISMLIMYSYINSYAASKTKVTSISFGQSIYVLQKGKSKTLSVKVSPSKASNKTLSFKSSNTSIATVNSKGTVKAKKTGTVTITATAKDGSKKKATCTIKIVSAVKKITTIKISSSTKNIYVGNTLTLKTSVSPSTASLKTLKFTSSNTKVATVNTKGVVKGIKKGTATITATALDGSKKKATIQITVKNNVAVKTVTLSSSKFNLFVGKTKTLTAKTSPLAATIKTISWYSSNSKIATVSSKGKVKGIKKGTATITVKITTTDGRSKKASATVNVKTLEEDASISLEKWYAYSLDQNSNSLRIQEGSSSTTIKTSKLIDAQVSLGMSVALPDITPLETLYQFLDNSNTTGFASMLFGKNKISKITFTKDTSINLTFTDAGKTRKVILTKTKSSVNGEKKEVTVEMTMSGKKISMRTVFTVEGNFYIYISSPGKTQILSTPLMTFVVAGSRYQLKISETLNKNMCNEYSSFINFKNVNIYNVY